LFLNTLLLLLLLV